MKILVTGSAGFIGFHTSKRLLDSGYDVIGLDNLNNYYDINLKKDRLKILQEYDGFTFHKIDLKDQGEVESLFKKESPQRVIHLAAQAGVVLAKLKYLDQWTEKRRKNAQTYNQLFKEKEIADQLTLPSEITSRHVYNQYVIRVKNNRDELRSFLTENNIFTEIYYPLPLHLQDCFASLGHKKGAFPESEKAANDTIALPIFPELTQEQLSYVTEKIDEFIKKYGI